MFGKWFKRESAPTNDGKSLAPKLGRQKFAKVYDLELSNMENSPVYSLTHQISIGSEIGNIIVADPSVSPRHASFILQQEVVSIIDHSSVAGTFVNGHKIPPGKYIILEETDVVKVGDLEVRLKAGMTALPDPVEEITEVSEEEAEEVEEVEKKVEVVPPVPPNKTVKKTPKKKNVSLYSTPTSANALVRVLALAGDFLVAYALVILIGPFDEFQGMVSAVPELFGSLIGKEWNDIWSLVERDYGFLAEMGKDAYKFVSGLYDFLPLLLVYAALKLSSTLLFGVSVSQFFLGIRSSGNFVWKRIGGLLRDILGFMTWPFLIFDLPSVLSRRTFKEILSFTQLTSASKFVAILGALFYLPLTLALVLFAPLFQGLESPEALIINETPERRVRARIPVPDGENSAPVEANPLTSSSNVLGLKLSYRPDALTVIPEFRFRSQESKLAVTSSLIFFQHDLKSAVEFELFKKFDMRQLLGIGLKGNFFLFEKYPRIYDYVYTPTDGAIHFKRQVNPNTHQVFANEFIQFLKTAFSLSPDNVLEVMESQSLLIKSLVDFRSSFLSLLEYKEPGEIGFIKIGNVTFMKINFMKQKPFDLLIPLVAGEGKIFKVTFETRESYATGASKFYKFNLDNADWFYRTGQTQGSPEELSALRVYDLFSSEKYTGLFSSSDLAQTLYGHYFEKSASLMQRGDQTEVGLWNNSVAHLIKLLGEIPVEGVEGETVKEKLLQNFRDLHDALENSNLEYFGISPTTTI